MKRFFSVLAAAAIMSSLLVSCGKTDDEGDIYIPIRTGNAVNYKTETCYVGTILEQVTIQGDVTAPYTTDLCFTLTGGKLAQMNVRQDQEVSKGDVIAVLDDSQLEDDIVIQELTLNSAKTAYQNLRRRGGGNETEFARISMEIEQIKYDELVEKRDGLVLTAPFDGRIVSIKNFYAGSNIDRYETLCTISDSSRIYLTATDYASQLSNVEFGTRVDFKQGEILSGTGKVVDTITNEFRGREGESFTAVSYVIQPDEDVDFSELGGVDVTFTTLRRDEAVIAPTDAVYQATDNGGYTSSYVNVLMNGIKVQTPVTVGVVSGDKTEILSGLSGGERLILP